MLCRADVAHLSMGRQLHSKSIHVVSYYHLPHLAANPESDIAGYKVHYDTDAAGYPYVNSTDVGNLTSHTLSSLNTGTTYYTAVSAYDSDGNESWVSSDASVTTLNTQPTATDANAIASEGASVLISVTGSDSDGDSLTFTIVSQPANGSLAPITVISGTSAAVVYTPTTGFSGTDTFTYVVNDNHVDSAPATVTVTVISAGDPRPHRLLPLQRHQRPRPRRHQQRRF